MATDLNHLRRGEPRSEVVTSEVRGIASRHLGREQGPFILWDISDKGLRLWMPQRVDSGELVKLTIAKPIVVMVNAEIRWCHPVDDGTGFQVGVRVLDNHARIEALHRVLNENDITLAAVTGA